MVTRQCWTYLVVEKRMNGDESEKACACDAAQASSAAVVESFIVVMVVVVVMPGGCVGVGVGCGLVPRRLRLSRDPRSSQRRG